jgi:hypothetical protein
VKVKTHNDDDDDDNNNNNNNNFTRCSVLVYNLVSHNERRTPSVMFENTVLGRIREPRTEELTGSWRKLLNEELLNLYSTIKSRNMVWVGYVNCMGRLEMHTKVCLENFRGSNHLADLSVVESMILKSILKERDRMVCTKFAWQIGTP